CEREKDEIAARHKGVRQAVRLHAKLRLARQRRLRNRAERWRVDDEIAAQSFAPAGKLRADGGEHVEAAFEFDAVPLAVVETYRFNALETLQRPREASRRVLTAGKENERGFAHRLTP